MADPNIDPFQPSLYDLNTAEGSAAYEKFCGDWYQTTALRNATEWSMRSFVRLITHDVNFFRIAQTKIPELNDNAAEWTRDTNAAMKYFYANTRPFRPLPNSTVHQSTEHELIKRTFAHRFMTMLQPLQVNTNVTNSERILSHLAGDIIADLFGDTHPLQNNQKFMKFANEHVGQTTTRGLPLQPQHSVIQPASSPVRAASRGPSGFSPGRSRAPSQGASSGTTSPAQGQIQRRNSSLSTFTTGYWPTTAVDPGVIVANVPEYTTLPSRSASAHPNVGGSAQETGIGSPPATGSRVNVRGHRRGGGSLGGQPNP